jgi:hypothetical protein
LNNLKDLEEGIEINTIGIKEGIMINGRLEKEKEKEMENLN